MSARILTTADFRHIEAQHADADPPLMDRAGRAAAAIALEMLSGSARPPLILAGPGNNGGDGFVVARILRQTAVEPVVLFVGDIHRLPTDARQAYASWCATGSSCISEYPPGEFGLIVDALFGIGLTRPIEGIYSEWIGRSNAAATRVLALDTPSGLDTDTGTACGSCIRADRTVSFIALKPGLLTADGPDLCGRIDLCPLDLDVGKVGGQVISPDIFKSSLRPRLKNSHKGSFGSVAVIGGAPGMAGAALLAGRTALKLGAGLVYLGMLEKVALDPFMPEMMFRTAEETISRASVLAVGPGLGQSEEAGQVLARTIDSALPLVLDADGLNLLAHTAILMSKITVRPAPTLFTPHPAEAARLLGCATTEVQSNRLQAALDLARRFNAHVALKGCGTIIATPEGRWFINSTGNPGLATAGSGDVLTGMLAALLAQGWPAIDALLAAVHIHGAAADACAAKCIGPIGLSAGELIDPAREILNNWVCHKTGA